jgi:hypothetical protein
MFAIFVVVHVDDFSFKEGTELQPLDTQEDSYSNRSTILEQSSKPVRHSDQSKFGVSSHFQKYVRDAAVNVHALLFLIGASIIMCARSPGVTPLMAFNVNI